MKRLQIAFIFIFAFLGARAHAQVKYPELSEQGFQQLKEVVEELSRQCPAKNCLITFVGRSNILISAYMDAQGITNHVTLPASGIRSLLPFRKEIATTRFSNAVLNPILKPRLKGVQKIVIVDYINQGGSLVQATEWIQRYARKSTWRTLRFEIMSYGGSPNAEYQREFAKRKVNLKYLGAGSENLPGSPAYLAKQSMVENYAPFNEWNPADQNTGPVFDSKLRRVYPYYGPGNQKNFTHYASYDDLVELFKKENPIDFIPKDVCNNVMRGFID